MALLLQNEKELMNMSKSKIIGMVALIVFAMGILLVGDAVAGERVRAVSREVYYMTTSHTVKVPDVEGHAIHLWEAKGISSSEKLGACLVSNMGTLDLIKGEGTHQGYGQVTCPDGSTFTAKFEGKNIGAGRTNTGSHSSEGTTTIFKGTGKFEGIQGGGTYKSYNMGPGQWYSDVEFEYTLP
jgi:hypothetical protein